MRSTGHHRLHRLDVGQSITTCGLYFLPAPLKHSNVPPVPVPKDIFRMQMEDGWARLPEFSSPLSPLTHHASARFSPVSYAKPPHQGPWDLCARCWEQRG